MQVPDAELMKNGECSNYVHSKHFYDTLPFFAHRLQKIAIMVIPYCRVETGSLWGTEDPEFEIRRIN
jgi:hypothetical protein